MPRGIDMIGQRELFLFLFFFNNILRNPKPRIERLKNWAALAHKDDITEFDGKTRPVQTTIKRIGECYTRIYNNKKNYNVF